MRRNPPNLNDTISAISTPHGEGGIGVVRLSGPKAKAILRQVFSSSNGALEPESHKLYRGILADPQTKKPIDEALAAYMQAPSTYTGEDVAELYCHGGSAVLNKVVAATINAGARLAERGEFTKRAFLGGRIDLAQAEAVIDLIRAKTEASADIAASQLLGGLSSEIRSIRERTVSILARIEAAIDFPEDIENRRDSLHSELMATQASISGILKTADAGIIMREGVKAAIIGKPNVGKSSLLNALLRHDRAIVSSQPGTTRDTIEEQANIKGVPVVMADTAGAGRDESEIGRAGEERARRAAGEAGLLIVVLDANEPLDERDREVLARAKGKRAIIALNKIDKGRPRLALSEVERGEAPIYEVSALYGQGIGELEEGVYSLLIGGRPLAEASVITSARHKDCLMRAGKALERALRSLKEGAQEALVAIDLKEAVVAMGEVTGEAVSEEVIDRIFSEFCVGK